MAMAARGAGRRRAILGGDEADYGRGAKTTGRNIGGSAERINAQVKSEDRVNIDYLGLAPALSRRPSSAGGLRP